MYDEVTVILKLNGEEGCKMHAGSNQQWKESKEREGVRLWNDN